jgi:ribulose-5-phosphate 4-epimerase/fuculose-1-phosphate aldolase
MKPDDIYVFDGKDMDKVVYDPSSRSGCAPSKPSACTPLFLAAFRLRYDVDLRSSMLCVDVAQDFLSLQLLGTHLPTHTHTHTHISGVCFPAPIRPAPLVHALHCSCLVGLLWIYRDAGACIHSHSMNALLATLCFEDEVRLTHLEMIKGIAGHGYHDELVIPIIENTAQECDLADSMSEAIERYPKSVAVLVRRHG